MNDDEQIQEQPDAAVTGADEAAADAAAIAETKQLYEDLGIKAPVPTGKTKGRPKTTDVRDKAPTKNGAADAANGAGQDNPDKDKSKDAPSSDKDGAAGDEADASGSKKREDAGQVSDKPEKTGDGVRKDESGAEGDAERGDKGSSKPGSDGDGEEEHEQGTAQEEGKRPGKSNPKVEQRFQKMSNDIRERDTLIEDLQRKLQDATRQQQEAQIAREDPEYTIDDFMYVRDNQTGEEKQVSREQAELYWRRWKDGHEQRKAERDSQYGQQQALAKAQQEYEDRAIRESVEAYDALSSIIDNYPELNPQSKDFDQALSDKVTPLVKSMIIYQPGTENTKRPVITGMRMNPADMLNVINEIRKEKRSLPLNGTRDTVESRSNVSVQHGRSSDPVVNQANELYRALGIDARL